MITVLSRIFIPDARNYEAPDVRKMYGVLCSMTGILLNVFLFFIKFFAGIFTSSVAVSADAFNNLSDAGSSVISFVGILCAGKPSDKEHPFGHGRIEYVAGFIVSMLIILLGVELLEDSVDKVLHPASIEMNVTAIFILIVSILIKVYMICYNYAVGKKIHSAVLKATAYDSLGDVFSTSVVLLSILVMYFTGKNMDGWAGILVAVFVLFTGLKAAKETLDLLLGAKPDAEFIAKIYEIVFSHELVLGVHDIVVHDYGPGHQMVSLHVEVPGDENVFVMHDLLEHIEADLDKELACESVIHMDPAETHNKRLTEIKQEIGAEIQQIDQCLSVHDIRMRKGEGQTERLLFDVVIPQEFFLTEKELQKRIQEKMAQKYPEYEVVIKIDKDYVS